MNLNDYFKSKADEASNTKGALLTFADYVDSTCENVMAFMSDESQAEKYISLQLSGENQNHQQTNRLCLLSKTQYNEILNMDDLSTVALPCSDSNDTLTVSAGAISDAMESTVSDLVCQKEFVKYCLSTAQVNSSEFMSRMASITNNIASGVVSKYADLISISGSPVEAIKNFFATFKTTKLLGEEDYYLEVVDYDDYGGSVWEAAWTKICDDISYFFRDVVWEGLLHIGEFFSKIWDGVLNLIKWGIGQLFGNLLTDYEKASNACVGVMDLPMFTFDLGEGSIENCTISNFVEYLQWIADGHTSGITRGPILYSGHNTDYCLRLITLLQTYNSRSIFVSSILNSVIKYDDNNKAFKGAIDVVVPLPDHPFDFALRLGWADNNHIILMGYVVADYSTWSSLSDNDIEDLLTGSQHNIILHAMWAMSTVAPGIIGDPYYSQYTGYEKYSAQSGGMLAAVGGSDLVHHIRIRNAVMSINNDPNLEWGWPELCIQCLFYLCMMGKGFAYYDPVNIPGRRHYLEFTDQMYVDYLFNFTGNYRCIFENSDSILYPIDQTINLSTFSFSSSYTPYLTRDMLPNTIHYQNNEERAQEILNVIKVVVLIAVVIYVSVKVFKASKKFARKLFDAKANLDRLSWDAAASPNDPQKIAQYNAAYKKYKKLSFIGNILGMTSKTAVNETLSLSPATFVDSNKANYEGFNMVKTIIIGE